MKFKPKDTAWPPAGVRDLRPDVPVDTESKRTRFPTLREALSRAPGVTPRKQAVTPSTLTEHLVSQVLRQNSRYRDVEYLCRAYLQFGREAMSARDLQRLCAAINEFAKG